MGLKSFGSQSCWDRIGTKSIISSSIGTKNAHQSNAGSKSYSDPDVVVCFQSDFSIKFGKKKHECYTMGEEWLSLFFDVICINPVEIRPKDTSEPHEFLDIYSRKTRIKNHEGFKHLASPLEQVYIYMYIYRYILGFFKIIH